ncbi:MAG: AmmeMemoRadiSam system radical SAM enzyme [Deltaproteobacteria bacterium]|nr:AmmeMemoRadiSam system radical SAM enzyme [Candidatus Anaeroferrophillus wilburensis]MBN2888461.1 AmmeMemoRadiSam system radical SAM enzyme [Deltaproteobacteria bacterium]
MKEAMLYEQLAENRVKCHLCAHECRLADGKRGVCGVRENRNGVLYSLVYDKIIASHVDPIEKKPLYHVLPGSLSYSIATPGCNFRCRHCQNYEISQMPHDRDILLGEQKSPQEIVAAALRSGCETVAYTYTEPTVYFELAYDTACEARARGLKNVFVSNGFMTAEAAAAIAPFLDAINIDVKSFSETFYREVCGARLQPVLDTIRRLHDLGVWIEITTLVIPGYNDSDDELGRIAEFVFSVSPSIPWHVTGFYPTYKLTDAPPTPVVTLRHARQIGLQTGLRYVYEGNRPGEGGESTTCHACGSLLIERYGFSIRKNRLENGCCPDCQAPVDGVFA